MAATGSEVEPFEVAISEEVLDDLRQRLARTRWPDQPEDLGWDYGADFAYLRELCEYWRSDYDWRQIERALNGLSNWRWHGLHFIWERAPRPERGGGPDRLPVCLIHGWPGGPVEFLELIPLLIAAGHDVIVPSLPGFAFSDAPPSPLNVDAIADRFRALIGDALGYERYAVQGGDWGALIGARMAFDDPDRVAALHLNATSVLPLPGDLSDSPLSDAEQAWVAEARHWRTREGFHMLVQAGAPDAFSPGLNDSPIGLAAWLLDKYRRWSDCDGEVERRFSKDDLCDFVTLYWATGTIASSMRLYAAEARDLWRLQPGERIAVPAAVADFPAELLRPPRAWTERQLSDLRRWSEFDRGGHFAAFEEPELLAEDVIGFLAEL